jgi:uncharacterized protein YfbU (UPF0304 family)
MKLTRVERLILSNQYKILEFLDRQNASDYASRRAIIESGYELHYEDSAQHISPEKHCLTEDDCREVIDILSMFRDLKQSYEALSDKGGVEPWSIEFRGFDSNHEARQLGYCRFFCDSDGGRFTELNRGDDFNSHAPILDAYRRMLEVWRPIVRQGRGRSLTIDQIREIVRALPHPESEMGRSIEEARRGPIH